MEETFRHLAKISSTKQSNDPQSLYSDCQKQLQRLKKQLSAFLEMHRKQQFKLVLPTISTLSQEIQNLKENIGQQITLQQRAAQRVSLTQSKEKLLKKIDQHSQKIEKYKKKLQMLNIDKDQLQRQCQENRRIIQQETKDQDVEVSQVSNIHSDIRQKLEKDVEKGRKLLNRQISLPSIFSKANKSICCSQQESQIKQSKQAQIDKLLSRITNLYSDGLAVQLIKCAKEGNRSLKSIFQGYNTNAKLAQFMKDKEVKRQLQRLSQKVVK